MPGHMQEEARVKIQGKARNPGHPLSAVCVRVESQARGFEGTGNLAVGFGDVVDHSLGQCVVGLGSVQHDVLAATVVGHIHVGGDDVPLCCLLIRLDFERILAIFRNTPSSIPPQPSRIPIAQSCDDPTHRHTRPRDSSPGAPAPRKEAPPRLHSAGIYRFRLLTPP